MATVTITIHQSGTELVIFGLHIRTPAEVIVDEKDVPLVIAIINGKGITDYSIDPAGQYPAPPALRDMTNVFIGPSAGAQETQSHRLYIANSDTTTPIIYGEFDNDVLIVNADVTINGTVAMGGVLIEHSQLVNTHNITTDIDHDQITNTHNLSTDIDHNGLTNYDIAKHRLINDGSTANYELWSSLKIDTEVDNKISAARGVSVASLSGGKIPSSELPDLAITTVYTAVDEAAQLALNATTQEGDVVVRLDTSQSYIRNSGTAGDMTDWTGIAFGGVITSINGDTGPVAVLTTDDINESGTPTNLWYSQAERDKLTGIASSANLYVHPTNHNANMIITDSSKRFVTDAQIVIWDGAAGGIATHESTYDHDTLTDGSNADILHIHNYEATGTASSVVGTHESTYDHADLHTESHTIFSHDTDATGANLTTLTDGSDVGALHTHTGIGGGGLTPEVINKTTSYTILTADLSKSLRMTSASSQTFDLPTAPDDGSRVTLSKLGAGNLVVQAGGSEYIADSTSGGTITESTTSTISTITLEYVSSTTTWNIISAFGTWATA